MELARRGYMAFRDLLERAMAGEDISDAPEWEVWDADIVIVEIADYPDTDTYRGHEGMRRWLEGWLDAFDEVLRFRGGKVTYATGYHEKSKALEAAGLAE